MTTIDVNAILEELHHAHEGSDATAAMLTLLAYSDDVVVVERIRERAHSIAKRHPARVVLFDATRDPQTHDTQLEWIDLGARGLSPDELASIAHAFTVQDIPTVLLWAAHDTTRNPAFSALNALAASLVLDSSRLGSDTGALRELTEYFEQGQRFNVQDLAYLRLAPWQEMIAQFFDDLETAGDLNDLRNIEIVAGSQAEAFYLLGWLASRLGWKHAGPGAFTSPAGSTISYDLVMQGDPRRVRRVVLASKDTTFRAALEEGSDEVVCLTVEGAKTRPRHCEPLHDISNVALVERSILMPETSDVFRGAIESVRVLLAS
jgi:hypothetical protein